MKIDCHVHITPPDIIANWEKYAEKEPYFAMLCSGKNNKFATAEEIIAVLETENALFDRAVVFGFAFRDNGLCRYVNDYVIEKVRRYPKRLTGFCVVSPRGEAVKEIERCYSQGLAGVGELFPQEQGFDPANEEETAEITRVCSELDIPLLLHANEPVGHFYPGKTDVTLKQLETFVTNNPSLKIILAHWGGGLIFYETMREIREKFKNVYYDTAAAPFLYDERIYSIAKTMGLCEKILFGSDFPLLQHSRYIAAIEQSGLSDEEKRLVLGGNAKKLLKI
jgi:predicted TIM-barrel fold metal-dependent hydrolase